MSKELEIKIEEQNGQLNIAFIGSIDEDSDFSSVDTDLKGNLVFDLSRIELINSCGIREWIKFQESLINIETIIYQKCPQVIIEQMNIVKGFIKEGGVIESFFAPYYDEKEDQEVKILLKPSDIIDGKAPTQKGTSGNDLEFDDIEAQYFNFIKNS